MEMERPLYLLLLLIVPLIFLLRLRYGKRFSGRRDRASFILKTAAISFLSLSLAGLTGTGGDVKVNAVYAVDVSRSMGEGPPEKFLNKASQVARRHPEARNARVILFGRGSKSIAFPGPDAADPTPPETPTVGPLTAGTDIAGALRRASGLLEEETVNRVVLFTDGRQTEGDAAAAAEALRALGGELIVVAPERPTGRKEVAIEGLRAPGRVKAMEPFKLLVTINSEGRTAAGLDVFRDGLLSTSREIELRAGLNSLQLKDVIAEEGLHHYRALVRPSEDGMAENNSYETFVEVVHKPVVLLVHGDEEESRFLLEALHSQGFNVVSGSAEVLPASYPEYTGYAAIILQNVSGLSISRGKMEMIERYVRDAGGGLAVIGGGRSLDPGYYRSPLERLLPVTLDSPSELNAPAVALVLVIDKSDSMSAVAGNANKLELAKLASYNAVGLMRPFDRVGLLAFDSHHFWAVPMIWAREHLKVAQRLRTINTGGGTDLHPALKEAYDRLLAENSAIKHVLILSDGLTEDKGFDELVRAMVSDKITVSTVAMGHDADAGLMERIAANGGGRYYFTDDPGNVPTIFLTETLLISRRMVVEGEITPLPTRTHDFLKGIDVASLPTLKGYIRTYPKENSRIVLVSNQNDPLLADWQYGLGKVAVFTSDLSHVWGAGWLRWKDFGKFAAQLVRNVSSPPAPHQMELSHRVDRNKGRITVDLYDQEDEFMNLMALKGKLISPYSEVQKLNFTQSAPGRYDTEFSAGPPGPYFISLYGRSGIHNLSPHTVGFAVPYRAEYASWGADLEFLSELAAAGGGKVVSLQEMEREIYRSPIRGGSIELWPFLAFAALICYFLSVLSAKWPWSGLSQTQSQHQEQ